jgi:predicted DNA binding protein
VSTLTERLDSAEVQYIIRSIHSLDETEADRLLTDRQIEVLRTASEMGYYSMPREVTQKEVADRLGVTKATCNTLLQRVESSVFGWFVSEHV